MDRSFEKCIRSYFCITICFSQAIIFTGMSSTVSAQASAEKIEVQKPKKELDENIYMVVEQQPEFPGGPAAKKKFFSQNLVVQKSNPEIKGRVLVSFVVNADGSLQDISLFKSLHPEYDKAALQLVNLMPKWIPGRQSGKNIRVRYIQAVKFP